jgi:hypothetical protein
MLVRVVGVAMTTIHPYVLTLREIPRSSNRPALNRTVGHREKREWQQKFLAEMMVNRVQRKMAHANVAIEVRWKFNVRRDWHNWFHGVVKPLADALTSGGYLPDDTGEYLKIETPFEFVYVKDWPPKALHKVEMIVKLEAEYD